MFKNSIPLLDRISVIRVPEKRKIPKQLDRLNIRFCRSGVLLRALGFSHIILLVAYIVANDHYFNNWTKLIDWMTIAEPSILAWIAIMCLLSNLKQLKDTRLFLSCSVFAAIWPCLLFTNWVIYVIPAFYEWPVGIEWKAPLLAAILAFVFGYFLLLRERSFRTSEAQARYAELQARIRPHFFFNALNSVSALVHEDAKTASKAIDNLADLFRAIISRQGKYQSVADELDLCKRYLDIEKVRFGERMIVHWDVGENTENFNIPALTVQPLLENAVKYGVEPSDKPCTISIQVRTTMSQLVIEVQNSVDREANAQHGAGIAIENIKQRLLLVYDLDAKLETKHGQGYFLSRLTIPL